MPSFQHILFDLDGTITDPEEGITGAVRYAIEQMGLPVPSQAVLRTFIGPPLDESLIRVFQFSPEQINEASVYFRQQFQSIGLYQCRMHPGMGELLQELHAAGKKLYVATTKPEWQAIEMLRIYELSPYFTDVCGTPPGSHGLIKHLSVAHLLAKHHIPLTQAVMVGDRRHDIAGGHKNHIPAIGVRFGYAPAGELEAAHAEYIADDVPALRRLLLEETM